jgi:thiosulfate dehydrogenase [quinone] large subunit
MNQDYPGKTQEIAYVLARLPIGMSMFGHGFIRLTKLRTFSEGMVKEFAPSLLPSWTVIPFSNILPFAEFLCGLLLLIGLFTRFASILGIILMIILIFGSSVIEQWNNAFTQIFYGGYFCILYRYANYNHFALDNAISKKI